MTTNTTEKAYQKDIYTYLESTGYIKRTTKNYEVNTCLDMELVLKFIQSTQPKAWKKFEKVFKEKAPEKFIISLVKQIDKKGTIHVLRNGFKDIAKFKLFYPKPNNNLNPELESKFNQNIFSVIDELEFQCSNPSAISHYSIFSDALNNIPVVCSQCGKNIHYGDVNWIAQYKTDTHREVISRSLVGGSTVRRKSTITYATGRLCYCNECYNEYKRVAKENAERHSIKGFFKKLFK